VSALIVILLCGPAGEEALKQADAAASVAKSEPDPRRRAVAIEAALNAYASVIEQHPKDRRLVPRVRRRRASLLKKEGRLREALEEHDRVLSGRSRRKDRAKALYDGAKLLEKMERLKEASDRYKRAAEEFPDVDGTRAKAVLARGRVLERLGNDEQAVRAYRFVIKKCGDEAQQAVEAYDRLALLEIRRGRTREAKRWIYACVRRYERRAARGDKRGAYLSRLLGDMRSPLALTKALGAVGATGKGG